MITLQEVVVVVVGILQKFEQRGCVVNTQELVGWNSVPQLVMYFCVISYAKGISGFRHCFAFKRTCFIWLETERDMVSGKMAGKR